MKATSVDTMRLLTVSSLHREWGESHRKNECVVPSIRLNGKWLAALGIVPGQKIRVVTNGQIIIIEPLGLPQAPTFSAEHREILHVPPAR
jgi:Toxin SymE, type I toxin-antitoxin system